MKQQAYIAKLENDNHLLKCQLAQFSALSSDSYQPGDIPGDIKLFMELNHLENLGNNFPNGCLLRIQIESDKLNVSDEAPDSWIEHLHLIYASPSWEQISNISRVDVMRDFMTTIERILQEDLSEIIQTSHKCLTECTLFNAEFRCVHSDSEIRWFQLSVQPRISEKWTVCEGFLLDITDRKKAEIELAEYRNRLEMIVKERTEELVAVNEELEVTIEELRASNEELMYNNEHLLKEMKARASVMNLLEESEAKLRNFIDQSLEGILVFDSNGRVIEWNAAMENITGIKKQDALQMNEWNVRWQLYPEDHRTPQTLDDLHRNRLMYMCDENSKKIVEDITLHRSDGSVRHTHVSMFPIKSNGTTHYFGRIFRDVTQQRFADIELSRYRSSLEQMVQVKTRELTEAKEKAEESDMLKSAFLANMSHEVRTPLNGIVGLLNILSVDPQLPESIREYIDIINNNSEILQRLINDILDAAKLEAGLMAIITEPFCVNALLEEMQIIFQQQLKALNKTQIKLENVKDASDQTCTIYADPVRLRQIIHNLLSNAVKFTDTGYIRFGYHIYKHDMIEFFVEDTGVGIPKAQLEHIFERFRQAEIGNNRRFGGTGLGLTISRNLAQLMGGDMFVTSAEGKGSTFTFSIAYNPVIID
jgi:PAS domain S-box-containing protein